MPPNFPAFLMDAVLITCFHAYTKSGVARNYTVGGGGGGGFPAASEALQLYHYEVKKSSDFVM